MRRVLVTGGAGYIGSHACKALARAGFEPVTVDSLVRGHRDAVRWGPFERADIRDADRLDAIFKTHRPDLVVHFAGLAYVAESVADPALYADVNVGGSHALIAAMRRNGVRDIVFSSTCATYGVPDALPISEDTPQVPVNPYGETKLDVERALAAAEAEWGLRFVALRYFNAAGADPEGELGERHEPETHAVPRAILAALGRGGPFRVFGADYPTRDGTALRDYVHVSDLADAHARAIAHLDRGGASGAFNLATGAAVSVFEVLTAVEAALGRPVPHVVAPRRPGDPPALYAVAERARRALGWAPAFTDFGAIVATAADWFTRRAA